MEADLAVFGSQSDGIAILQAKFYRAPQLARIRVESRYVNATIDRSVLDEGPLIAIQRSRIANAHTIVFLRWGRLLSWCFVPTNFGTGIAFLVLEVTMDRSAFATIYEDGLVCTI